MSGGQDEASEYIKTGGVNVFKKTERTKCGNCVYYELGSCQRYPARPFTADGGWCGEFVDRKPEGEFHQPVKAAEEVKDQPPDLSKMGVQLLDQGGGVVENRGDRPSDFKEPADQPADNYQSGAVGLREMTLTPEAAEQIEEIMARPSTSKLVAKQVPLATDKPAELREWWAVKLPGGDISGPVAKDEADHWAKAWGGQRIRAREVPSADRVRAALDKLANNRKFHSWKDYKAFNSHHTNSILTLLRSLGIDTEGV